MLPTIDMSEPMQEAVPAFVVGSDLAHAWSCGCAILPMTSGALTDAFLSFSGTPLFVLVNMSTSCFRRYKGAMRKSADFNAAPTYHLLNAAALNSRRNRNFVHRKGEPCARAVAFGSNRLLFTGPVGVMTVLVGRAQRGTDLRADDEERGGGDEALGDRGGDRPDEEAQRGRPRTAERGRRPSASGRRRA
jgi:hypothetical protein